MSDPFIPVPIELRSSTVAMIDAIVSRLRADRELKALDARVDRETMIRLAVERGIEEINRGLTMRVFRRNNADLFDPMSLVGDDF